MNTYRRNLLTGALAAVGLAATELPFVSLARAAGCAASAGADPANPRR